MGNKKAIQEIQLTVEPFDCSPFYSASPSSGATVVVEYEESKEIEIYSTLAQKISF